MLPPPVCVPAHQRRCASTRRPSCQRDRAAGRHRRPDKHRTLAPGGPTRAACARQHVRQPPPVPPARASVPRGHQHLACPGAAAGVRQRAHRTRVPLPAPAGSRSPRSAASAINTRRAKTARPTRRRVSGVRAQSRRRRETLWDKPEAFSHFRSEPCVPNCTEQVPSCPIQALFPTRRSAQTCLGALHQPSNDAR